MFKINFKRDVNGTDVHGMNVVIIGPNTVGIPCAFNFHSKIFCTCYGKQY